MRETEARAVTEASDNLKQLEWMVGEWIDESPDTVVEHRCAWSADGHFLLGKFLVQIEKRPAMTGTTRIGWDRAAAADPLLGVRLRRRVPGRFLDPGRRALDRADQRRPGGRLGDLVDERLHPDSPGPLPVLLGRPPGGRRARAGRLGGHRAKTADR